MASDLIRQETARARKQPSGNDGVGHRRLNLIAFGALLLILGAGLAVILPPVGLILVGSGLAIIVLGTVYRLIAR